MPDFELERDPALVAAYSTDESSFSGQAEGLVRTGDPAVIAAETAHYLPFLMTTTVLMAAVKSGVGRETAHQAIKEHALATVRDLREGRITRNDLIGRLAGDARLGLSREALDAILAQGEHECGAARQQVARFAEAVKAIEARYPQAAAYQPGDIL
jgi:adenylosuccinate lyase